MEKPAVCDAIVVVTRRGVHRRDQRRPSTQDANRIKLKILVD
jgi:hypothetical protein